MKKLIFALIIISLGCAKTEIQPDDKPYVKEGVIVAGREYYAKYDGVVTFFRGPEKSYVYCDVTEDNRVEIFHTTNEYRDQLIVVEIPSDNYFMVTGMPDNLRFNYY